MGIIHVVAARTSLVLPAVVTAVLSFILAAAAFVRWRKMDE